ncbi:unnamed protein product [Agarophyton chilense]
MENSFTASDGSQHHVPNYEYHQDGDKIHLEVELPGVQKEHLDVEMRGSNLCISGLRFKTSVVHIEEQKGDVAPTAEKDAEKKEGIVSIVYELQVKVGANIDEGGIRAEHKDGILKMLIPLKTETAPLKIAITQG